MNKENIINTIMVSLVLLVVLGSGGMIYKNLHDKEVREAEEKAKVIPKVDEKFVVIETQTEDVMKAQGYVMYKGVMYNYKYKSLYVMEQNVLLPGDIKVLTTGRIIYKDESEKRLLENEIVNLKGEIAKNQMNLSTITPMVQFASPSATITP